MKPKGKVRRFCRGTRTALSLDATDQFGLFFFPCKDFIFNMGIESGNLHYLMLQRLLNASFLTNLIVHSDSARLSFKGVPRWREIAQF